MTRRQYDERLALGVATGLSVERAADQLGISRATAYRRLANPALQRRVAELRQEITNQAVGQLVATLNEAILVLRRLMVESESDGVKLRAATQLVETGLRAAAIAQLEQRIVELETALKARERQ
jgi:hypothetical protein